MNKTRVELTDRQKKIRSILEFKGVQVPSWISLDDEEYFFTLWQIREIEKLFKTK